MLWSGQLSAIGFPKPEFSITYSKTKNVRAGDIIDIIIKFNIADGFHVYSEKSDCPEYNGPIRASIDFTQNGSYEKQGNFKGIGDHMVLEEDIWNCSTGEFTGKGEFRQKIKVLGSIEKIEMLFNGQICNESGCENLRDIALTAPSLTVSGSVVATIQEPTRTNTTAVVREASNDENPLEDTRVYRKIV